MITATSWRLRPSPILPPPATKTPHLPPLWGPHLWSTAATLPTPPRPLPSPSPIPTLPIPSGLESKSTTLPTSLRARLCQTPAIIGELKPSIPPQPSLLTPPPTQVVSLFAWIPLCLQLLPSWIVPPTTPTPLPPAPDSAGSRLTLPTLRFPATLSKSTTALRVTSLFPGFPPIEPAITILLLTWRCTRASPTPIPETTTSL